ncbi:hypothetical protein KCP69_13845 [Salmonella enterica subsp. enterica]|nr:hypothetical protein KCP69_13845 [Salmonella enterica subsp. enterica]
MPVAHRCGRLEIAGGVRQNPPIADVEKWTDGFRRARIMPTRAIANGLMAFIFPYRLPPCSGLMSTSAKRSSYTPGKWETLPFR